MQRRAPDPHNLRNAARAARFGGKDAGLSQGRLIEQDRECSGCGYNLRGLRMGMQCPECGQAIAGSEAFESDDPLSLAPSRVILAFIRGCWAASIIVCLVVGLLLARNVPVWETRWTIWSLPALALLWLIAVAWLTPSFGLPQAISRGFSRRSRLRRATRWLQCGWLAAAVLLVIRYELSAAGTPAAALNAAFLLASIVGVAGLVLLSIMLERLAEWTRDDTAQNLFNWSTWTLPICPLLLAAVDSIPAVGRFIILTAILLSVGIFPYALLSLSSSVTLCVVHAYEHRERSARSEERRQRYHDTVSRTVDVMDRQRSRRGRV